MIQLIQHAGVRLASRYHSGAIRDCTAALAMILGFAALAFMPMFFLLWLMQPKVLANPATTVRVVPRIVYAEPPPADLDLLQAEAAPRRDAMQFTQSEAKPRQAGSANLQAYAYKRITRAHTSKVHAARTPATKTDARRIATRQMHQGAMLRNAQSYQNMAETDGPYQGNRIAPGDSIDWGMRPSFPSAIPQSRHSWRHPSKASEQKAALNDRDLKAKDLSRTTELPDQVGLSPMMPRARL